MARTVNEQGYAEKRNEIINVAQRLIFAKGYERMTIGDVLTELKISSGAFYHYFDSKPALLEAFIERGQEDVEKIIIPIIHDPNLSAIEKLQCFFDTLDQMRSAQQTFLVELLRVWYTDHNAIVREKVNQVILERRGPMLNEIIRQGIQEGIFTTAYPDQAGEIILSLLQGMGNTHARLLLSLDQDIDEQRCVEEVVAVHAAYMEAVERVLGAPPNSLYRTDDEAVKVWVTALRENES